LTTLLFYTAEDLLGDALIKLPAILALRKARPDIYLVWVAGRRRSAYSQLLRPLTDGLFNELHEAIDLGARWSNTLIPFWKRYFDVIIASEAHLRSTLTLRRIPHNKFIAPWGNYFFSDSAPQKSIRTKAVFQQTLQLLALALNLELSPVAKLPIPEQYVRFASELLPPGPNYIGIVPGAGGKDKCWPLQRFIALAQGQTTRGRRPVFLLGPSEVQWRSEIQQAVPSALFPEWEPKARELRSPTLTIAIAQRLNAAVANDSGGGHLVCAGGCPVVTLIGRTDEQKFESPYISRQIIRAHDYGASAVNAIPLEPVLIMLDQLCATL
jgi:ADP-heptose:LPS heptosyltransferase